MIHMWKLSPKPGNYISVFCFAWILVFMLYLPAVNAGFVADFTGWLDQVRNNSFWEFINRKHFSQKSLYQFTQAATWFFYQVWGANTWLWHLLHITIHALNTLLLFIICKTIFEDSNIKNAESIAFYGVVLFCISPSLSEIIVWEPAYHFLQGLFFILVILYWLQKFLHNPKVKYACLAASVFFLSIHSLEIFYITPWLALSLIIYYRVGLGCDKKTSNKAIFYFFIPLVFIFVFYLLEFRLVFGVWIAHVGSDVIVQAPILSLGKPAKYLFHMLFLGRFFPNNIRNTIYAFCDSTKGILLFYSLLIICLAAMAIYFRRMSGKAKAMCILFVWVLLTLALILPLWFPDAMLVWGDRYTYFTSAFLYMLLVLLFSYISLKYLKTALFILYALINIRFTIQINRYWMKSSRFINHLLHTFPDPVNKITLLLDLPDNMHGVSMVGATEEGEFNLMLHLFVPEKRYTNKIYDVAAFNLITPTDGVHVKVLNDSTIGVTLNQWGTWWWYGGFGALSYESPDYKVNMIDGGHYYELTLKQDAAKYLILYQSGSEWKTVDWNKKNIDQY